MGTGDTPIARACLTDSSGAYFTPQIFLYSSR